MSFPFILAVMSFSNWILESEKGFRCSEHGFSEPRLSAGFVKMDVNFKPGLEAKSAVLVASWLASSLAERATDFTHIFCNFTQQKVKNCDRV